MTVFSFPYREERSRAGRPIFRPSVTVELQDADGRWHPFRLYADAGADITLLREADCRTLGYELEAGEEQFMGGIGPGLIRTFVHQVRVRLGTVELCCRVSFATEISVPRLLGREGVFDHFRVCYDDIRRITDFILGNDPGL